MPPTTKTQFIPVRKHHSYTRLSSSSSSSNRPLAPHKKHDDPLPDENANFCSSDSRKPQAKTSSSWHTLGSTPSDENGVENIPPEQGTITPPPSQQTAPPPPRDHHVSLQRYWTPKNIRHENTTQKPASYPPPRDQLASSRPLRHHPGYGMPKNDRHENTAPQRSTLPTSRQTPDPRDHLVSLPGFRSLKHALHQNTAAQPSSPPTSHQMPPPPRDHLVSRMQKDARPENTAPSHQNPLHDYLVSLPGYQTPNKPTRPENTAPESTITPPPSHQTPPPPLPLDLASLPLPPLPGYRMPKHLRAKWQPRAAEECKLGAPFPPNFYWWHGIQFSHPFTPPDLYLTQYPGSVLLNHPCFTPREAEVRSRYGKLYFYFDPEPVELLEVQVEQLRKANEITIGHFNRAEKDGRVLQEEIFTGRKFFSNVSHQIAQWQRKTAEVENLRLKKRISDLEASLALEDAQINALSCAGCNMPIPLFISKLTTLRETTADKERLVTLLTDDIKQTKRVIKSANYLVANCIQSLRGVSDLILQIGYGQHRDAMEKARRKYTTFQSPDSDCGLTWDLQTVLGRKVNYTNSSDQMSQSFKSSE
ncbi:hypothetical protein Fcan01_22242 [Folsomia candida]|uniref:Uncharacterized protein n=1 Tax=Folsomia candida TaxID=158441 RepID=A0A226DCI3_FOLCA|nr:hypothetical protein Fcan01_22242 [Folsomia candida]